MTDRRVVYTGNYRAHWCTEVHIAATLEDMGFTVTRLQEDTTTIEEIEEACKGADLYLYQRTWGMPNPVAAIEMFRRIEAAGVKTASYHLDLYLGLEREVTLEGDPFWSTQFIFTPDGAPSSQAEFDRRGLNHHYIKPGVFRAECVPGDIVASLAHDVCFVGSYPYPHAEWPYRNQLVEWLASKYGGRFGLYGGGTVVVRGKPLNDLYASAKVIVGDSLCLGFDHPYYWSDRATETLGRGGFLIHPWIEGMDEELVDGEHLRYYTFGDFEGLHSLIDFYLDPANDGERRRIAAQGQAFVRENCTYHNRLSMAMGIVGL